MPNEFEIPSPPSDSISCVKFAPQSADGTLTLQVSSWDSTVTLYNINRNTVRAQYNHQHPVLAGCWSDTTHCFSGSIDHVLKSYNLLSGKEEILGEHNGAISTLAYCPSEQILASGSWDSTIKLWDMRVRNAIGTYKQPDKVFAIDFSLHRLIVGTRGLQIKIWDIRKMTKAEQSRTSSLKNQIRCIRSFIDGKGYAVSSTEGRVGMEYFDPQVHGKRKFAFKCHREKIGNGVDKANPVNDMAFHPIYGTFATGGCDGCVSFWDGENRRRLTQLGPYNEAITSLDFSPDGKELAIAASFAFECEEKENLNDSVFIRSISDVEVKPRTRKKRS